MKTVELKKLLEQATKGPWKTADRTIFSTEGDCNEIAFTVHQPQEANAALIALAPDLAAEVVALREEKSKAIDALAALIILTNDRRGAAVPDDILKWAEDRIGKSDVIIDDLVRAAINMPRKETKDSEDKF